MAIAQDLLVNINWHELRILTIWASNYASAPDFPKESRKALESILRELEKQRPKDYASLTIAGEIRELQQNGHDCELRDSNGKVVVPRVVKN